MKYKVGDKVRYGSGEWWFYGTVSAIIENSINPCYRLNVERMEKRGCKFSITQFEFELEADIDVESDRDKRKWETSEVEYLKKYHGVLNLVEDDKKQQIKTEAEKPAEPEKKQRRKREKAELSQKPEIETPKRRRGEAWDRNFEQYQKGEKSNAVFNWTSQNRKLYKTGKLDNDKYEKLLSINFSFDSARKRETELKQEKAELTQKPKKETSKRKRGEAWDINYESYRKGEKSNIISTWMANNRREYKSGKLSEEKFEKLVAINFPFDVVKKKRTVAGKTD